MIFNTKKIFIFVERIKNFWAYHPENNIVLSPKEFRRMNNKFSETQSNTPTAAPLEGVKQLKMYVERISTATKQQQQTNFEWEDIKYIKLNDCDALNQFEMDELELMKAQTGSKIDHVRALNVKRAFATGKSTQKEVADALGLSPTTVRNIKKALDRANSANL